MTDDLMKVPIADDVITMTDYKELTAALREEAEAVQAIEWEIPICTSNHISDAADAIEQLVKDIDVLTKERDELVGFSNKLKIERDAAIEDLKHDGICRCCKKNNICDGLSHRYCGGIEWEWRGVTNE